MMSYFEKCIVFKEPVNIYLMISFGKLTDNNMIISKGSVAKIIDKNNKLTAVAHETIVRIRLQVS